MNFIRKIVSHIFDTLNKKVKRSQQLAQTVVELIPSQCPFERNISILGVTTLHIPPLCKLNPFYNDLMELRYNALNALVDVFHTDVTSYIS